MHSSKFEARFPMTRLFSRYPIGAWLAALPVLFLTVFFVVPSFLLFVISFFASKPFEAIPDWNIDNYARIFTARGFWLATLNGLSNGFFTATISLLMAFPVAWFIVYRTRTNALLYLILLSWFSSYLVRVYAWRSILGTNGVINSLLIQLGIVEEPLSFLIFSPFASVIALVHIMVPFALLILVSAMRDVKPEYLEAVRDLGGGTREALFKVIIPMSYKGVVGSYIFSFILAAGDYIIPQLLGGLRGMTSGLLISNQFRSVGNWPLGAAMAFVLMGAIVLVYVAFTQLLHILRLAPGRRYHD